MPVACLLVCGLNDKGQLGDGTTTNRLTVVPVSLPAYPVDIATGGRITVACTEEGYVYEWGGTPRGEFSAPSQTPGPGGTGVLSDIVAVAAAGHAWYGDLSTGGSWHHVLALARDGSVWAWGKNAKGQLGDGTTTDKAYPVRVVNIGNIVAVAAGGASTYYESSTLGGASSYALSADGKVYSWGMNTTGQLGDGTTTGRVIPGLVVNLSDVVAIAAGAGSVGSTTSTHNQGHALALRSDGTVWAWGRNNSGQLGDGTTTDRLTPVKVSGLTNVVAIAAGGARLSEFGYYGGHSLALKDDGTVWAWGNNAFGQLGNGTTANSAVPVQVSGLTDVVAIAAGGVHSLARKSDGTVWAWGHNAWGELGDGSTTNRTTPVQVSGVDGYDLVWKLAGPMGGHTVLMQPRPGRLYLGRIDGVRTEVFVGSVLAGNALGPIPIPILNLYPANVSGVKVTCLELPPGDTIEVSATRDPFVAEDPVYLSGTFGPGEQIGTVWVRVKPPILVDSQPNQGIKQFTLRATNATA